MYVLSMITSIKREYCDEYSRFSSNQVLSGKGAFGDTPKYSMTEKIRQGYIK